MLRFVACFVAFACWIGAASADPRDFNRTVAFGDSLSDNGNFNAGTGLGVFATPSPPYFFNRFSNGPTFIELVAGPVNLSTGQSSQAQFWGLGFAPNPATVTGDVNLAIGGVQTAGGPFVSVQNQIASYIGVGGTFGPRDLVSVQGGANDFFNFFTFTPNPTPTDITNFAVGVGTNAGNNVNSLIQAGARAILVSNLPNLGLTPNFNTSPTAAAGGFLATTTYNATLNGQTQTLAAQNPGVNLVQVDWFAALNVVVANPAAFGFTNVTTQCFVNVGNVCTNPDQFLFWDGVHPTARGHALLAQYIGLLLSTDETGKAVAPLGQVALSTRLEASDILFRRGAFTADIKPGGLYAEGIGASGTGDGKNSYVYGNLGFDYNLAGVRGGFDANYGRFSFGSSIAYQEGDISSRALSSDLRTTQFDVYALARFSQFFAGLEGGVSFNDYANLERNTGFPTVKGKGSTSGTDYTVAGTLGSQFQLGGITLTPAARAGYVSINVDGFTETAPLLALQYGDREITAGFWSARLRASAQVLGRAAVFGEVGYEDLFSLDKGSYQAKLFNNTAKGVTIADGNLEGRGLFVKAGIGGYVSENVKISGEYGLSLQNGNGDVHSGRLQLTIPLNGQAR